MAIGRPGSIPDVSPPNLSAPVKKGGFNIADVASKLGKFNAFSQEQQNSVLDQLASMGPPPPVPQMQAPPVDSAGTALISDRIAGLLAPRPRGPMLPMVPRGVQPMLPPIMQTRGEMMTNPPPPMGLGLV